MIIHLLSKYNMSNVRTVITIFIFISLILFTGCKDESDIDNISVELKSYETYKHTLVTGDEEGAKIKTQARHFEISEITRNAEDDYAAVYTYKPTANYIGRDYVEIEILMGSDGASQPSEINTIRIIFTVTR